MAKRPRMGRNLDALLGGSTRERKGRSSSASTSDAAQGKVSAGEQDTAAGEEKKESAPVVEQVATPHQTTTDFELTAPATAPTTAPAAAGNEVPASTDQPEVESVVATGKVDQAASKAALPASAVAAAISTDVIAGTSDRFRMVGVDQIRRGSYQPRRLFDQELLQELADSIKAEGLIQPIIVRPFAGAFELVAGERRWRAAQLAGMAEIPAIIREMPDKSVAAVSVIENIQRKDLNPLEEAAAFERLCDEFGMTHKAVAESVGRSRASVTNLMRLLELHDEVKVLVDKGELEMGHARAILGAPRDRQHALAKEVIEQGLTVRSVEKMVREIVEEKENPPTRKPATIADPDIERLSKKLGETLGATVRIQHKATGRGKLEINYASVAELQGILAHIK